MSLIIFNQGVDFPTPSLLVINFGIPPFSYEDLIWYHFQSFV